MPSKVLIFDTSVLCCWLKIPGKETAGPANDRWTHNRIAELLAAEKQEGSTFVLPIATLIETGNHIANCNGNRFELASSLSKHLRDAADAASPWAAFTEQASHWERDGLLNLANHWPQLAAAGTSIADATIKQVAEHYASAGMKVEILTGDQGLKAYQPDHPVSVPRRRG